MQHTQSIHGKTGRNEAKGKFLVCVPFVAFFTTGCSIDIGMTELDIADFRVSFLQAVEPTPSRASVEFEFEGPSSRPCYHVSDEELRVTLDDVPITSYMDYRGGYNDKGAHCNTFANFIGLDVPTSEVPISTLAMADDSGTFSVQCPELRNKRTATLREPADGRILPSHTVLIVDLSRPEDPYEEVFASLKGGDGSKELIFANPARNAIISESTFNAGTLTLTLGPRNVPAGTKEPINILIHGELPTAIEGCKAKKCSAAVRFWIAVPAVIEG